MTTTLNSLKNSSRGRQSLMRVGRGPGSGKGKTSGRGQKGAGARSGYKRRYGKEGGQFPLYMKLPTRGFSRARFRKALDAINLGQLARMVEAGSIKDGDTINLEKLREIGYISGPSHGLKILGEGELKGKFTIEANAASAGAQAKLQEAGITLKLPE